MSSHDHQSKAENGSIDAPTIVTPASLGKTCTDEKYEVVPAEVPDGGFKAWSVVLGA